MSAFLDTAELNKVMLAVWAAIQADPQMSGQAITIQIEHQFLLSRT